METVLFIACVEVDGSLTKHSLEVLTAAAKLAKDLDANFVASLIGAKAKTAASSIATCGAVRFLVVTSPVFDLPQYATDVAAVEVLAKAAGATCVVVPDNSRFSRALPGVAVRLLGRIDTHLTDIAVEGSTPIVSRWLYRQRIVAKISRIQRPWLMTLAAGCFAPFDIVSSTAIVEDITIDLPIGTGRTTFVTLNVPPPDAQTIRPDAQLLFVAGAGWTKKQVNGQIYADSAEKLILSFLNATQASLGSSKSLVDICGEGYPMLPFLTHIHQVGQTGSSPRHPKGLATCCHGEEPHVVGWRFIGERRAVNIDASCGWAQGKADVLYVADAFTVMARVNELLK